MTCYRPIQAYRVFGESKLYFNYPYRKDVIEQLHVPCGRCVGCRLERSRQWAVRCIHEASLHPKNCFITLTFDENNLPYPPSIDVRDFQLFMKRLRKKYGNGIRFFHCGEYGEKNLRPHYHACLFGFDFPDKKLYKNVNNFNLYVSPSLSDLWPFGFHTIGDVTFESAAYVARYIMKKVTGDLAQDHYSWVDPFTGEVFALHPEYVTMSRRSGIGYDWFNKYSSDVYPNDHVIIRGRECRPPRYYDNLLKKVDPLLFEEIHFERYKTSQLQKHIDNNTPDRLLVREQVKLAQISKLTRPLEGTS